MIKVVVVNGRPESGKTTFEVIGENETFTRLRVTIGLLGEELQ